jgi:hypothetical protein
MTDAPERIWATGNTNTGCWNDTSVAHHGVSEVEYVRADLARAAPTVKPLEWHDEPQYERDEYGCDKWGEFSAESIVATCKTDYLAIYRNSESEYMWVDGTLDNIRFSTYRKPPKWETVEIPWFSTVEAAKAAAQADYERRILSALK